MYVCMYVSDFAMSLITYPADFVSTNAQQPLQEVIFEVSIKIFVCYIQVIYWNVTVMREKRNEYRFCWKKLNERDHQEGLSIDEKW